MAYFSIPPHPVPYSQMSHRIDDHILAVRGGRNHTFHMDRRIGGKEGGRMGEEEGGRTKQEEGGSRGKGEREEKRMTSSSGSWYLAR